MVLEFYILFKDYKIKRMKDAIGNNYRNAIDVKSNDKKIVSIGREFTGML